MPRFNANFQNNNFFNVRQYKQHIQQNQSVEFDGKRLRKAVVRKTIDYNAAVINQLEARMWQRDYRDQRAIQPDTCYYTELVPPLSLVHNPINAVTTKFVRTSTNKMRCPIFCVAWTPEGRRLVTGASSGEFTLWNGLTFNFETILQAHDSPVRCMVWSHNDTWMVTGDHTGFVKYWQSNMNNVKMFLAHKEPVRGISFCPTDTKFATCSDDGTVRVWDFLRCNEERILRGHGADVKCVDWHPQKGLLVSGSKDSQQPIKLWDPKNGQSLATLHAHKSTVMEVKWNANGNWMLTASRDHLIKLFDIRNLSQEIQTFRGHKKEVASLAWHTVHETLFASGGSDGAIMFWVAGADKEVGAMEQAHESIVWSLSWHPLGHILCSGSNDHSSKFWTRNHPGDKMRDKYNLNTVSGVNSAEEATEYDEPFGACVIPGMGLDQGLADQLRIQDPEASEGDSKGLPIPGLDFGADDSANPSDKPQTQKKVPYAKQIPHQFQRQWMENKRPLLTAPPKDQPLLPGSPAGEGQGSIEQGFSPRGPEPLPTHFNVPPPGHGNRMGNMPRMPGNGTDLSPRQFSNNMSREDSRSEGQQDGQQGPPFPYQDSFSQQQNANNFGDSDLRMPPPSFGESRFPPPGQMQREGEDPRLRLHSQPYKDFDARQFSHSDRGRGDRGGSMHNSMRGPSGAMQHQMSECGDSDMRVMDGGRNWAKNPNMEERSNAPMENSNLYSNTKVRKRPWEEGPGDERTYQNFSGMQQQRENVFGENYNELGGGGAGRANKRGGGGSMRGSRGSRGQYRGMSPRGRAMRGYN